MKKIYIIIIVLIVVSFGSYLTLRNDKKEVLNDIVTYSNAGLGIQFNYRTGPDGYVIQELAPSDTTKDLIRTIIIMRVEEATQEMPVGGEGPATITIQVVKNSKKQQPAVWAGINNIYSNINLKRGEVKEYVLGGANAIRYDADGLYVSDTVVAAHGENMYVIAGSYMDIDSDIRTDFIPLLESITFIPQPGQN